MKNSLLRFSITLRTLLFDEQGQDLIEYALVVALIAFSSTATMRVVGSDISKAFSNIATTLSSYTS